MVNEIARRGQVHIVFDGYSNDIDFDRLDVGELSTDTEIRRAVANFLDVPEAKLQNFTVNRNEETQTINLAPQAVFGSVA